MPHSAQARKRVRQSERSRVASKSARSEIKSLTKALAEKVDEDLITRQLERKTTCTTGTRPPGASRMQPC